MTRPVLAGCLEPAAEAALRAEPSLETAEVTAISVAVSLKRIADALDSSDAGGRPQGSILYFLEMIASAANAGRS